MRSVRGTSPSRRSGTAAPPSVGHHGATASTSIPHVSARWSRRRCWELSVEWPRRRSPTDRSRPRCAACRPLERRVNAAVVHVPDGQRQRGEPLQVVVAEHLLASRRRPPHATRRVQATAGQSWNTAPWTFDRAAHVRRSRTSKLSSRRSRPAWPRGPTGTAPRFHCVSATTRRHPSDHRAAPATVCRSAVWVPTAGPGRRRGVRRPVATLPAWRSCGSRWW